MSTLRSPTAPPSRRDSMALRDSPIFSQSNSAGTKFRNSCDACSASKLRCSRERPTCSRCAKRSETCIYSPSKRVPKNGEHSHSRKPSTASPLSDAGRSTSSLAFEPTFMPHTPLTDPSWADIFSSAMIPDLHASIEDTSEARNNPFAIQTTVDSLQPSEFDFSMSDSLAGGVEDQHVPTHEMDMGAPLIPGRSQHESEDSIDVAVMQRRSIPNEHPTRAPLSLSTRQNGPSGTNLWPDIRPPSGPQDDMLTLMGIEDPVTLGGLLSRSECGPLMRCLGDLAKLSVSKAEVTKRLGTGHCSLPRILSVVHKTCENVRVLLAYESSFRGGVLMLVPLMILKILEWYRVAVQMVEVADKTLLSLLAASLEAVPSNSGDSDAEENEDSRRIVLQRILQQLARVHHLVGRLAQRVASPEFEDTPLHLVSLRCAPHEGSAEHSITSAAVPRELSNSLHDNVCRLSRAVAKKLRQS